MTDALRGHGCDQCVLPQKDLDAMVELEEASMAHHNDLRTAAVPPNRGVLLLGSDSDGPLKDGAVGQPSHNIYLSNTREWRNSGNPMRGTTQG